MLFTSGPGRPPVAEATAARPGHAVLTIGGHYSAGSGELPAGESAWT